MSKFKTINGTLCRMEEPKPTFKLGDWVKYDIDTYLRVIEPSGKERTLCRTLSGEGVIVYPYTSCLTKVSPSEVVVHIGGMSGTVRKFLESNPCDWAFRLTDQNRNECIISFAMLDTATCVLVESLLKAQGEEMNPPRNHIFERALDLAIRMLVKDIQGISGYAKDYIPCPVDVGYSCPHGDCRDELAKKPYICWKKLFLNAAVEECSDAATQILYG